MESGFLLVFTLVFCCTPGALFTTSPSAPSSTSLVDVTTTVFIHESTTTTPAEKTTSVPPADTANTPPEKTNTATSTTHPPTADTSTKPTTDAFTNTGPDTTPALSTSTTRPEPVSTAGQTTEGPTTKPETGEATTGPFTTVDTTEAPTTRPETPAPTTEAPTTRPVTPAPTTVDITGATTTRPETPATTEAPTTRPVTTVATTEAPTTRPVPSAPTTIPETAVATTEPFTTDGFTTEAPTTEAPTTKPFTTDGFTTEAPTTEAPTTKPFTTDGFTTEAPTTEAPTTKPLTTDGFTTEAPTTEAPTTKPFTTDGFTTEAPTTEAPTTKPFTTDGFTTEAPTTEAPTTKPFTTDGFTTEAPTTEAPTTKPFTKKAPTPAATTGPFTTDGFTTEAPTTEAPTTKPFTTKAPTPAATTQPFTTDGFTTEAPTTQPFTTDGFTTEAPTTQPFTTDGFTTEAPTTQPFTTDGFTTEAPTTEAPTTKPFTTDGFTTEAPTTQPFTTASTTTQQVLTTTGVLETIPPVDTANTPPFSTATSTTPPTTPARTTDTTRRGPVTPYSTARPVTTALHTTEPHHNFTTVHQNFTTVHYNFTTVHQNFTTSTRPPPSTGKTSTPAPPTTPPPRTTRLPPTTSAPPLVCHNGGKPDTDNRVCLCPDEWIGPTCLQENFCRERHIGGFNFPRTAIGRFAYSEELCPQGSSAAGKPRASVRCSVRSGSPGFQDLQELQCDQSLSDIQQNLTSPADLEVLASSTQILTSRPEALTAENVTTAAQITNTLLLSPNATESVRVAAVATVSQLLSAEAPEDAEENATLSLTQTLDQLSLNLSLSSSTSQSQVVQPNLVVQSAQVPVDDTRGVQFTSLSGLSGSFAADRIQLNTNASTPAVENGFIVDVMVFVQFPAVRSRQTPSNASLGFLLYQNDRFFRSRLYRRQRATVRVLSASVRGQERSVVPQQLEMRFRPQTVEGESVYDFACVFWDYGVNDWSTSGCWKGSDADGALRCFCNHTTNFAALWSFREDYEYAKALSVISYVGLSVSILGLIVTIIHHLRENFFRASGGRQRNRKPPVSFLCVCLSLLIFIIIFLSGVQNSSRHSDIQLDFQTNAIPSSDERVEPDAGACTAVTALLHYFLLATFTWNGIYGTELTLLIRSMRRNLPAHWTAGSLAVGWGVPAVVMAIPLGVMYRVEEPLKYRQEEFCWLAALDKNKEFHFGGPMFWGFLIPVGLILVYNLILMVLVSMTTCRTDPQIQSTKSQSLSKKVLVGLSVTIMLGLSWTLGYLVLVTPGDLNLVFSILFCISTGTQGLQIFILFTARTKSFRKQMSGPIKKIQYQLQFTKYSLIRVSERISESISESYRSLWGPENSTSPRGSRHKNRNES